VILPIDVDWQISVIGSVGTVSLLWHVGLSGPRCWTVIVS